MNEDDHRRSDVSIVLDDQLIGRTPRGVVTAAIALRDGESFFPAERWTDMAAAVLSALCNAEVRLLTGVSTHETVSFVEGPFELDLEVDEAGRVLITCIEHALEGRRTVRTYTTQAADFARSVATASQRLLDVCESRGWNDRDTDRLRTYDGSLTKQLERSG